MRPLLLALALAVGGLGRVVAAERRRGMYAGLAVGLIGVALGILSGGVLMGAVLPLGAVALAVPLSRVRVGPGRTLVFGLAVVAAGLLAATLLSTYTAGTPTWLASWLLGGTPTGLVSSRSFETLLRSLGFGLFPYGALALLALLRPLAAPDTERPIPDTFADLLLLLLAAGALALGSVQLHLTGQARLLVLVPAALAVGRLLAEHTGSGEPRAAGTGVLMGALAALGALVIARDLAQVPEELASLHLATRITWPPGLDPRPVLLAIGAAAALACLLLFTGPELSTRPGRRAQALARLSRGAPCLLLAAGAVCSLVLAHHLVPALSRHLSHKHLLDSYHRHRLPGAALALYPGVTVGPFDRASTMRGDRVDRAGRGVPGATDPVRPGAPGPSWLPSRPTSARPAPGTWWSMPARPGCCCSPRAHRPAPPIAIPCARSLWRPGLDDSPAPALVATPAGHSPPPSPGRDRAAGRGLSRHGAPAWPPAADPALPGGRAARRPGGRSSFTSSARARC